MSSVDSSGAARHPLLIAAGTVLTISLLTVAGWVMDWQILVCWLPNAPLMVMNTALCGIWCGLGLLALALDRRKALGGCGGLLLLFGGTIFAQFALRRPLGINELFWHHQWAMSPSPPGQMAPHAAVAFALIGVTFLLFVFRRWVNYVVPTLVGVVLSFAVIPLLTYATAWLLDDGSRFLLNRLAGDTGNTYRGMALPAATCVIIVGAAVWHQLRREDRGSSTIRSLLGMSLGLLISTGVSSLQNNGDLLDEGRIVLNLSLAEGKIQSLDGGLRRLQRITTPRPGSANPQLIEEAAQLKQDLLRLASTIDLQDPALNETTARLARLAGEFSRSSATVPPLALTACVHQLVQDSGRALAEHQRRYEHVEQAARTTQVIGGGLALALLVLVGVATWRAKEAHKATESRLAVTHRLLRATLDGTVHSVITTDLNGMIEVFNHGAERMLGYAHTEMVGRQTPAIIHLAEEVVARAAELSRELGREVAPGFEAFVARARLGGADEREWTYVRKDGSHLPVRLSVTALRDERGDITGFLGVAQDLSERKKHEAEAFLNTERLRLAADAAGVAVWDWNVDTGRVTWDAGMFSIYGLSPTATGEVGYQDWADRVLPQDLDDQVVKLQALVANGGRAQREFRIQRYSDRAVRFIHSAEMAVRDRAGKTIRVVGINLDITERQHAEEARLESERRFHLIVSSVRDYAIFLLDQRGCVMTWNEGAASIKGYTAKEIVGQRYDTFFTPEARDAGRPRQLLDLARTTGRATEEGLRVRKDGTQFWADIVMTPLQSGTGELIGYVKVARDITARKRAESVLNATTAELQQQKFAFDQHAIVATTDVRGRIVHANDRFCALSGYTREELLGQDHRLVNSGTHPKEFFATMYRTIARGEVWHGEICNRAKDGSLYWVDSTIVPLLGANGKPEHYISIRTDITEQKRLEQSLAVARDQALEASRLKSEFLATMSHEIRTPMNAIIGMGTLLADTPLNPDQAEMTRTLIGGAEGLLTVINDILDFSRIEAGKLRLDHAEFDFEQIVEDTVTLLGGQANQKELELTADIEPPPSCLLWGDGGRVRQVLVNLLGNAIKFTDHGSVAVTAGVLAETADRVRVRLAVRDTGIGIAPADQAKLFHPFVQVEGGTVRRFGGTGLGLAIARQLIESMGGTIGMESEPGRGSTFWFEVELRRGGRLEKQSAIELPAHCRVLVVDDNPTNVTVLRHQLTRLGADVESAGDGPAALQRLLRTGEPRFDLVVLDWNMPGMNGLALATALRAIPDLATLPLVVLSSSGPLPDNPATASARFDAVLAKPVTAENLARCLARVWDRATTPNRPGSSASPRSSPPPGSGLRVLLAEDNPANQKVAQMMLEKMGHTIELAAHGQAAIDLLARAPFDVVLMDCQMPVLDGYSAARQIRSGTVGGVDPAIPIIALTAYARIEDRARCLDAGMTDYLSKPLRADQLAAALARHATPSTQPAGGAPPELAPAQAVLDASIIAATRSLPGATGASLLPELIALYLSDESARLDQLGQLARERQGAPLADQAHAFGGNAASFGALEVRDLSLALESTARAAAWPEVDDQLALLRTACDRLRRELRKF